MSARVICHSSDRERWLRERARYVGASDVAALMGESPWQSAYGLWAQHAHGFEREHADDERMWWGLHLEPAIITGYAARSGRHAQADGRMWALDDVRLAATLDGLTGLDDTPPPDRWPLEVKLVHPSAECQWSDGVPQHYWWQLQAQCLVTGAPRATIAALVGGQRLIWEDVQADPSSHRRIVAAVAEHWRRVADDDPPPPDGGEATRQAQLARWRADDGVTVELPAELLDVTDSVARAKRTASDAERTASEGEALIREAMGPATVGVLPDGRVWTWREQRRGEKSIRVLRLGGKAKA
jgi:putative phage-type endonuclease